MSIDIEFNGPTPAKKSRQSEIRPSESFKSEYAREFSSDLTKANLKLYFIFKHILGID
jgi:hypothetical protein